MSLSDHFVQMARNNAWSNARLYRACLTLDHEELTAKRTSFFPSIWLTLQHLWIVDEYYLDGLHGGTRGYAIFEEEEKHRDLPSMWEGQRAADRRLLAYCEGKKSDADWAERVVLHRDKGPQTDLASDVVAHLFVHQIHHRGQVHAMLSGTRVAPPQLDEWFLAMDRPIAERELAEVL
jgi:uncharacterized damage-inducible protein DinB